MRILTLLLILSVSISTYADEGLVDLDQQSLDNVFNLDSLNVDRITLSTFHKIIESLETLKYPVDYSTKIVCDDNFGSIVLTIHNNNSGIKYLASHKVQEGISKAHNAYRIDFDLYVEVMFSDVRSHTQPQLFFVTDDSYERIYFSKSGDYYQRDIFPYYQPLNCSVCGGGSTLTKYGKLSHVYGCRYTLIGIRKNTLRTNNIPKSRKVQSKRASSTGRPKTVSVRGYYRKDGTYVRPHKRKVPRRR